MNKRIEELAFQAGAKGWMETSPFNGTINLEKFAELIVRECAEEITPWLLDDCAQLHLFEHFGVKE